MIPHAHHAPPVVVVVTGAPGSGKTTLAARLAPALGRPLFAKDAVKETLYETLGAPTVEESRRLGRATFGLLYAMAGWLLDAGTGLVLEANFTREWSTTP